MSKALYVLDASALLCTMQGEAGGDAVQDIMDRAIMSAVNLSEVVAKLQERGISDADIDANLSDLTIKIVEFSPEHAVQAGKLRTATRHRGLSLGDRACLALALENRATAVTTDRSWQDVDVGVKIQIVR